MAKPQHRTPEYRAAYRAIKAKQARGEWLTCVEPVCVMPTRAIAPTQRVTVSHDPTGTVILGPGHHRCNMREAAIRGNQMRAKAPRRRAL